MRLARAATCAFVVLVALSLSVGLPARAEEDAEVGLQEGRQSNSRMCRERPMIASVTPGRSARHPFRRCARS
jgi:hypothetical protein